MRHLKYVLIILFFTNCSGDKVAIDRLKGFEYPLDSLDKGKLFVYKRSPGDEYYYVEQKRVKESGTDFVTWARSQLVGLGMRFAHLPRPPISGTE